MIFSIPQGVNWLRSSWYQKNNAILGDDTGLGKKVQAICLINGLFNEGHLQGHVLILAPPSRILAWEKEISAWAPTLNCISYVGE